METRGIAVFDVCGTITKTNNTSDFIGFVLARDNALRYGLFLLIRILSSFLSFLGIRSLGGRDRLRDGQIALLRGYSVARLKKMSELYVDGLFRKGLLNGRVLEAMKQEREEGKTIYLISAAIDPPVVELAGRLSVKNCFSSELEMENGHYTGRLKTDLLGEKKSVLAKIPAPVDWRDSSVYSDNIEDSDFMEGFGRRNVVLNAGRARKRWDAGDGRFHFIAVRDRDKEGRDVHSVNERTVKWTYLPPLYYVISRFHRQGVLAVLGREIIPVTLAGYLLTSLDAFSFILMPLSFLMFYSIYEIGGLVNDLCAKREPPGTSIRRIAPHVYIHPGLFISIRVAVVGLILVLLPVGTRTMLLYAAALCFCLAVYLVHTLTVGHLRVLTFTMLKFCRNSVPLVILASHVPVPTLAWLCTIFFVLDAPWRVYAYSRRRGLLRTEMPVWRLRCTNTAILCGLGAVISLAGGSPCLFVIASYGVVLECLWVIHRAWFRDTGSFSGRSS